MGDSSRVGGVPTGMAGAVVAVFHAHPDDEVFATAAATQALAAAGAEVRLFIATGGELPEMGPDRDEAAARGLREHRLNRSCTLLGISSWSYLTRPGHWIDTTEHPRTLAAAPTATVADAVRKVIDDCRPEIVLSVGADGLTGHADHIAMHDAVTAALHLPGWSPRHAWGAAVVDSDVRAAGSAIRQLTGGDDRRGGRDDVTGVPAAHITRAIRCPDGAARKHAMDAYLEGLGSYSLEQLINEHGLRGASLTLRAVFDLVGWETDRFTPLSSVSPVVPRD